MKIRNGNNLQSAMTLVEVLIASSVGIMVLGALLMLVTVVAKEQRRQMVDSNLQQEANLLEDKITRLVRSMSASQAVIVGEPITAGAPFYRKIIISQGITPVPREQIAYDSVNRTCIHLANTSAPTVQDVLNKPTYVAVLRNMYFFISEKNDGAPDASAVSVFFQMDDNGSGARKKTNSVTRSFTATMRNN